MQPEFEICLVVEEQLEYAYLFSADRPELLEQFNQFIRDFRETEEYADILRRVEASADAPFQAKKVEKYSHNG